MHNLTRSGDPAPCNTNATTARAQQRSLMQHIRAWHFALGLLLCLLPFASSHAVFIRTTVDNSGDVGLETSLKLNSSGLPVISYYDVSNGDLKLATCFVIINGSCDGFISFTTVDGAGNVGRFSSLQLNASDFPVISYYDITNGDLKLAVCNDATCTAPTLVTVDSAGDVGQYTSLQLDPNGFPVISYHDVTNNDLKLAVCHDATCSTSTLTTVDSAGLTGQFTSLQLNASGFPVISYHDGTNSDLRLAACNDATCSTGTLTTVDSGTVGIHTSLRLSASGFPVISYWDFIANDLKLAVCNDATCTSATLATVDSAGEVGSFTSLQLDASGFAVISYWDSANSDLKLAVCNDATCSTPALTTVDSFGSLGQHTSLQLNASGLAVISYFDVTNTSLKLVTTVAARVNSVSVPASANYVTGQDLDFTISWTDPITVTGSPVLTLTIGATARNATYLSGSGTTALVFRHTVLAGDVDNDGINVGPLALSGGSLNWAGFPAVLNLAGVGSTAGVLVNQSFTVTPSAGANGSIAPNTAQFVAPGANIAFTVTPDPGYSSSVGGTCGGALVGTTYTTNAINANCTVVATFTQITYTVTPSAGANGSITPDTAQVIASGGNIAFTITPDPGFAASVGGTCGGTLVGTVFTTSAITANCTVAATFAVAAINAFTGPSATGTGNITASFTGGGAGCSFLPTPAYIPVSGHPRSPPAGTAPAGVVFPHGLFDFTTTGCTAASTITMTVTYPDPLPAGAQYWKYGPTPTDPTPHWYVLPATIAGDTATFTITDGQLGDDDLTANGTIVDQGGPGAGTFVGSIPTLSGWGMLLLALAMMGVAMRAGLRNEGR